MNFRQFCWTIGASGVMAFPGPLAAQMRDDGGDVATIVPAPVNFAGVWETARLDLVVLPEVSGTRNVQAQAMVDLFRSRFDPVIDDTARVCLTKGMPWTMLSRARNYPIEIVQYPDRIFMLFKLYDQYRNVQIGAQQMPEEYGPSPNGWSVARWEGDTLVIETSGLAALNPLGVIQRGWEATVAERWNLREDAEFGEVLQVDLIIDDPEVYATPATARQIFKRSPAGVVPGGYNCSNALWDAHIDARIEELDIEVPEFAE